MTSNPIDAHIADHSVLKTIETFLAAPEPLSATEAKTALSTTWDFSTA